MCRNHSVVVDLATPPRWKVSLEGVGHYAIYRAKAGRWDFVDYAFTIEQARQWIDVNTAADDTTVWEI